MNYSVIRSKAIWTPQLTHSELRTLVAHVDDQYFPAIVRSYCRNRPYLSMKGPHELSYHFVPGDHFISMRINIPPEFGLPHTFSKPLDVFVALPENPKDHDAWLKPWPYRFVNEVVFEKWRATCTQY